MKLRSKGHGTPKIRTMFHITSSKPGTLLLFSGLSAASNCCQHCEHMKRDREKFICQIEWRVAGHPKLLMAPGVGLSLQHVHRHYRRRRCCYSAACLLCHVSLTSCYVVCSQTMQPTCGYAKMLRHVIFISIPPPHTFNSSFPRESILASSIGFLFLNSFRKWTTKGTGQYGPDALPVIQPTVAEHGTNLWISGWLRGTVI